MPEIFSFSVLTSLSILFWDWNCTHTTANSLFNNTTLFSSKNTIFKYKGTHADTQLHTSGPLSRIKLYYFVWVSRIGSYICEHLVIFEMLNWKWVIMYRCILHWFKLSVIHWFIRYCKGETRLISSPFTFLRRKVSNITSNIRLS